MSKRVVLVSHGFQPNYEKGFANGLADNGVAVTLIGSDRTLCEDLRRTIEFVNLRGSQNPARSAFRKAFGLLSYIVRLYYYVATRRPDIVHLNGLLLGGVGPAAVLELLLLRLLSRRLWLTVHNIVPHDSGKGADRLLARIYGIPSLLIVHTERAASELASGFGISVARIVTMEHGVDDIPGHEESGVDEAQDEDDGRLRVLIFGAVMRYKGVDILLEALEYCAQPVSVSIVGVPREQRYESEIEALMASVAPRHRVTWRKSFVPEGEVGHIFQGADVVVLPYRHIDQSGVLFTAFRFGVPVICFEVGSFSSCVPEFAGMVVTQRSPEGLGCALMTFATRRVDFDRVRIISHARSKAWSNTVRVLLPMIGNAS